MTMFLTLLLAAAAHDTDHKQQGTALQCMAMHGMVWHGMLPLSGCMLCVDIPQIRHRLWLIMRRGSELCRLHSAVRSATHKYSAVTAVCSQRV